MDVHGTKLARTLFTIATALPQRPDLSAHDALNCRHQFVDVYRLDDMIEGAYSRLRPGNFLQQRASFGRLESLSWAPF